MQADSVVGRKNLLKPSLCRLGIKELQDASRVRTGFADLLASETVHSSRIVRRIRPLSWFSASQCPSNAFTYEPQRR
jgi:hypothetical protein